VKIRIDISDIKVLTAAIENWNQIQSRPLTRSELAIYGRHVQNGGGIQCGGTIVLQTRAVERDMSTFGRGSVPGDLVIMTENVIRGMSPVIWQLTPDGASNRAGMSTPADAVATAGTLEIL
jgi:hypothetical protein